MFQKWLLFAALFAFPPVHSLRDSIQGTENTDGYIHCDEGWFSFGKKCYKLFGGDRANYGRLNWKDASKSCNDNGGHLATVPSQEVQDFLFTFLLLQSDVRVWIGLNDLQQESHYEWLDGTEFNYSNWNLNEPSDDRTGVQEDCVYMILQTSVGEAGKWHDLVCNEKLGYICQVDEDEQREKSQDPTICSAAIEGGWKFGHTCYRIVKENLTWEDAEKHCEDQYKGHLVTILNFQTEYFLKYIMANFNTDVWIGIKIKDQSQQMFSSGWPVVYTDWLEPPEDFVDGTCVIRRKGNWDVIFCEKKHSFICEVSTVSPPALPNSMEGSECSRLTKDWVDLGGEYCYYIYTMDKNDWYQSKSECIGRGGSLASFHSKDELNALAPFVKNVLLRNSGIFIGLYRPPDNENIFEWTDGSEIDFTYWNSNEPSFKDEKCVEAFPPSMKWNDVRCEDKKGYICSAKKAKSVQLYTNPTESLSTNISPNVAEPEGKCECESCLTFKITTGVTVCILFVVIMLSVMFIYCRPRKKEKIEDETSQHISTFHQSK